MQTSLEVGLTLFEVDFELLLSTQCPLHIHLLSMLVDKNNVSYVYLLPANIEASMHFFHEHTCYILSRSDGRYRDTSYMVDLVCGCFISSLAGKALLIS